MPFRVPCSHNIPVQKSFHLRCVERRAGAADFSGGGGTQPFQDVAMGVRTVGMCFPSSFTSSSASIEHTLHFTQVRLRSWAVTLSSFQITLFLWSGTSCDIKVNDGASRGRSLGMYKERGWPATVQLCKRLEHLHVFDTDKGWNVEGERRTILRRRSLRLSS